MKLFKTLFLLMISTGFIFISACSDDDDDDNPVNNSRSYASYFKTGDGNIWGYDSYTLDMDQNKLEESLTAETVKCEGSETKDEQTALIYNTYLGDIPAATGTEYYYSDDTKLYTYSNYLFPDYLVNLMPIPIGIEDQWIVIANFSASSWTVLTKTYANETVGIDIGAGEIDALVNGTLTISGEKTSTQNISFGNPEETKECQEFVITYSFNANIKDGYGGFLYDEDVTFSLVRKNYYAKNVGLVKTILESVTISIPKLDPLSISGYEKILNEYTVSD